MVFPSLNHRKAALGGPGSAHPQVVPSSCVGRRVATPWRSNQGRNANVCCKAQDGQSAIGDGEFSQAKMQQAKFLEANRHLSMGHGQPDPTETSEQCNPLELQDLSFTPMTTVQSQQPASEAAGQPSWQQWLSYFQQADSAAEKREELALELKDAIRQELYSEAARIKAEINVLEAGDVVATAQAKLQAALSEERYADAATLRDGALTGLQGWWAGQAQDDPVGHLLHITPEFSRWTGRVFKPRDIAELKVNKPAIVTRALPRAALASFKPTGSPIMEVFVRQDGGLPENQQYLHQAVSLRLPTHEEVEKRRSKDQDQTERESGSEEPPRSFGPMVRLSVSIRHDGTASIRPLPSKPVHSHFRAWEAAEAEETLRMLRWSSPNSDVSSSTSTSRSEAVVVEPDEVLQFPEIPDEVIDISSQNAMSSLDGEDSSVTIVSEPSSEPELISRINGSRFNGEGLEELYAELTRDPARIELVDRDQLVFHVPHQQAVPRGQTASATQPAAWERSTRSSSSSSTATSLLNVVEEGSSTEEGTSSFEVIIPMAGNAEAGASGSDIVAHSDAVPAETLNILADQVAQSMEAKVGHAAPRKEIAEALREVVRRVASGEPVSSVDVLLSNGRGAVLSTVSAPAHEARQPAGAVQQHTSITYKRIPVGFSRTDVLSGLYLGSFGPHGPELLHLTRTIIDGEEVVQAMKLTGDANVPAGSVSFRARIGRKQRLDARDVYPDELGIMARYKGEGRVAQKGFTQPRWVEGELLLFNSKGGPLTGGAQLGFVWAVPGEKRFLILLNRVDLGDVGK